MEKNEIILNEVKRSYQQEVEQKSILEAKADKLITASGIILALLFGFSAINFINDNETAISKIGYIGIIVSIIIVLKILWYGFKTSKVTKYLFVLGDSNQEKKFIEDSIEKYEKMSYGNLIISLINDYMDAIKINSLQNFEKEKFLLSCEKWFRCFLLATIISIIFVIVSKLF